MSMIDIKQQIESSVKNLPNQNYMLGRTLMQPCRPANSGSRALMTSVHLEHLLVPNEADVAYVNTGYENEFGHNSTSYIEAKSDYLVLYKINKYSFYNGHYYLIVLDKNTNVYDVIERVEYNNNTERYGYLWNNRYLDSYVPGTTINRRSIIKMSNGYDAIGNKMNGVNLKTLYLSSDQNMEDSIIMSESAAEKLKSNLINSTSISINDNDILLDIYGNDSIYKSFPDIGEDIVDGLFCSIRRYESSNILFTNSLKNLRSPMISDRNITMSGKVVDIDVYCNNPSLLLDSSVSHNSQLAKYYKEKLNFSKQIVDIVSQLSINGTLSYELEKLYSISSDIVNGVQYYKEKLFSNIVMDVVVIEPLPMCNGDKMADRYGGKGVVSKIRPDSEMPFIINSDGSRTIIDVVKNQSTCINRENLGQLHEQSLTFIGMRFVEHLKEDTTLSYCGKMQLLYKYLKMVDDSYADYLTSIIDIYTDEYECMLYLEGLYEDGNIVVAMEPFTTKINVDQLCKIYAEFPWLKQYEVYMPMYDSNNNIRFVKARRNMVIGDIYHFRLKQYAEEKFSVVSLAPTNTKGLNTRSKNNKIYESKYKKTPIMFGGMETANMLHMGSRAVSLAVNLYSAIPQSRYMFESLLIGDPYSINIKLPIMGKNRQAEIIISLLKAMGLDLVFSKNKKIKKIIVQDIITQDIPLKNFKYATNIRDIIGYDDVFEQQVDIAYNTKGKRLCQSIITQDIPKDQPAVTNIIEIFKKYGEENDIKNKELP